MSRRVLVNLIVFVGVFFLMAYWAVQNIVSLEFIEQPYDIEGDFAAASGVSENSEVAFLGVHYGYVSSVELLGDGVTINMKVDKGKQIPKDSVARIFRKSAIGEPYIDFHPNPTFDPDDPTEEFYAEGDVVPRDKTTNPLEFSELLRTASELLGNVDPAATAVLTDELAKALAGRSDSLRSITTSFDTLAAGFAAKTPELDRLATNNTILTNVFAEHASDLGTAIDELSLIAQSLRASAERGDLATVLDDGSALMTLLANLVADEVDTVDCILEDLVPVIETATTPEQLAGLEQFLDIGPEGYSVPMLAREMEADGPWERVNLLLQVESPPGQYDPPRTAPTAPAVPPCQSNLGSGGGPDFEPAAFLAATPVDRSGPAGYGTGALAGMLVLMAAGSAALGSHSRRFGVSEAGIPAPVTPEPDRRRD